MATLIFRADLEEVTVDIFPEGRLFTSQNISACITKRFFAFYLSNADALNSVIASGIQI
ncbi:MAG: hypothetical protein HDR23_09015 [Lachnospiraceae bacterium]|nr:hypothetical protein [Lachnospiraceae bacterium]